MATPIPNTQRAAVEKDYNEAEDLITVNGIDSTKCANEDVTFEDKGEVKWTGLESDDYGMLKSLNKEIPPVENESITRCNSGSETSTSSTPPSQGRYLCPYCKLACAKPSVLQKHIRAHTNERPYPCLPCGFAFKTKSNLYKHCRSRAHALKMEEDGSSNGSYNKLNLTFLESSDIDEDEDTNSNTSPPLSCNTTVDLPKQKLVVPSFPSPGPLLGNTPLVDSYPNSHQRKKDIEVVFEDYEEHNRRRGSNTKKRRLDSDISSRGTSSTTSSPDTRPLSTTPILGTINTSTGTLRSLEELSMCPMRPNSLQMFGGEVQILDGAGETKTMRIEPSSRGNKTSTPSGTTTGIDTTPTPKETPEKEKVAKKVPKLSVDENSTEQKNQEDGTVITKFRRPTSLPLKLGTFVPKKTNSNGLMSMGMVLSLVSPETPRPKKSYGQLYLNGHAYTYLGLKCSTRAFYCTLNRPQPMYVLQSPEHATLSMYSNWKTCLEADPNPFGLEPGHAMCLYDSRHRPAQYSVAKPHEKQPLILTHSSYWLDKHKLHRNKEAETAFEEADEGVADQGTKTNGLERNSEVLPSSGVTMFMRLYHFVDKIHKTPAKIKQQNFDLLQWPPRYSAVDKTANNREIEVDSSGEDPPKRVQIFAGGFESNEDYIYVRGRGRGRYVCEECGIRCKKPSMLKKHIRTHTDVRPFTCKHCNFSFKTKGNLTKHMKSKAHYKKCVELGIVPVPTMVDESNINEECLARQQALRASQYGDGGETDSDENDDDEDDEDDDEEDDDDDEMVEEHDEVNKGLLEHEAACSLLSLSELTHVKPSSSQLHYASAGLIPISSYLGRPNTYPYNVPTPIPDLNRVSSNALNIAKTPTLSTFSAQNEREKVSRNTGLALEIRSKTERKNKDEDGKPSLVRHQGNTSSLFMIPPQQDPMLVLVSSITEDGRSVCVICNKVFSKPSQLRLHVNIHYFERPFRCESCAVSFRTKGHLQKHERSVSHQNKVSMNSTFGTPTTTNPRPFKCDDCKIAFRIHGHLAKHLRSKMHIMKLECLGKLPFGTYAEMEREGFNPNDIDTTDCENSLESLQNLAQKLYEKDPSKLGNWESEETHLIHAHPHSHLSGGDTSSDEGEPLPVYLSPPPSSELPYQRLNKKQDTDSHSKENHGIQFEHEHKNLLKITAVDDKMVSSVKTEIHKFIDRNLEENNNPKNDHQSYSKDNKTISTNIENQHQTLLVGWKNCFKRKDDEESLKKDRDDNHFPTELTNGINKKLLEKIEHQSKTSPGDGNWEKTLKSLKHLDSMQQNIMDRATGKNETRVQKKSEKMEYEDVSDVDGPLPVSCLGCSKSFLNMEEVHVHLLMEHESIENVKQSDPLLPEREKSPNTSEASNFVPTQEKSLIHEGSSKIVSCEKCSRHIELAEQPKSSSSDTVSAVVSGDALKQFICDLCSKKQASMESLQQHFVSNTQPRLFLCAYCDVDFLSRQQLIQHEETQHTDKAALELVQSNLAPHLCHRQRCNRSGATLFLYTPEIFWSSRTVERKWMLCVLVTALRSVERQKSGRQKSGASQIRIGVPLKCKEVLYRAYFIPIPTYGAEAWTLDKRETRKVEAMGMRFLRSMLAISRRDRIRNEDLEKYQNSDEEHDITTGQPHIDVAVYEATFVLYTL
uniref:C2H2-type domain-containing protein n=1 Tax=Timema tahoe TaxID=61484 RepID=A0A7R9IIA6_9NEOP|nr:unnamed protein product [Timema tahoe]